MDYAIELYGILSSSFSGNKARIKTMSIILIGIMKSLTTNLSEVAKNMPGSINLLSKYRKVQRFFKEVRFEPEELANYLIPLVLSNISNVTLIIDRTNWKLGEHNTNLLVLSIAWCGISLPIAWHDLGRAGTSTTMERMTIISKAIRIIGIENIKVLLGDREFIGEDWLHWLDHFGVKFIIRIKDNSNIYKNKKYRKAIKSFRSLSRDNNRCIKCTLWGLQVFVVGYKDSNGKVLILATNSDPNVAVEQYSLRWQIESMFLSLKSKGFNFEQTKMTCPEKLNTLFSLLAILTFWNCKIGKWANKIKPIKLKGNGRLEYNMFHYGMRIISTVFNNIYDYINDFKVILKLLIMHPDKMYSYNPGKLTCL